MHETKKQYLETFVGIVLGEAKTFYEAKFAEMKKRNIQLETQLTFLKDNPISKEEYIQEAARIGKEIIERELKIPKKTIPAKTQEIAPQDKFLTTREKLQKLLEENRAKTSGNPAKITKNFGHDSIMIIPEIENEKNLTPRQKTRNLKTHKMLDKADKIIKRITKEPDEDTPETDELLDDFVRKEKPEEQEKRRKKIEEQSKSLSKQLEEIEAEA